METTLSLPLDLIREDALLRDRLALDDDALDTLVQAIAAEGLRHPIEVFALDPDPDPAASPPHQPWGLISGLRRLTALRRLHAADPSGRWATIPATLRQPGSIAGAMAAMVSENEARAPVTPWEKGALLVRAVEAGVFPTLDAAVEALFPMLTRQARSRLRGFALVVETLDGALAAPRGLSVTRMDRLAAACRGGLADLMHAILADHRAAGPDAQWAALAPAVAEAVLTPDDDAPAAPGRAPRPRRMLHLRSGVTLRREWTRTGWILRINARHADHPGIVDDILDHVEAWFQKG
jgi:ParB family chromosome partitioning protein